VYIILAKMKTKEDFEMVIIQKALKDHSFRQNLIGNPETTIERELGLSLPNELKVRIFEEKSNEVILIIPQNIAPEGEMRISDLESVAGGWSGSSDCGTCDGCTDHNCTIGGC
jgi:hypothetical protein